MAAESPTQSEFGGSAPGGSFPPTGAASTGGVGYPPYPPVKMTPAPPSVADTIKAGHKVRIRHKNIHMKPARVPPRPAKPKHPKVTDIRMSQKEWRAHARCLRKHGVTLTDRLERISKPTRRQVINMWRERADKLPPETIARLRTMLDADNILKPDQAYEYFVNLKKTKKKCTGGKSAKKDLMALCGDRKFVWAKNATVAFARGIQQRLSRPGRYSLADGMLRLSNIVLDELCSYMNMRVPSRHCRHSKGKFMLEVSDKIAVWIDEILSESDDRMLMMDFDEDDVVAHADEPVPYDYADDFLNMMGGKGDRLVPPKPAYLKFKGDMARAFKILTDAMYNKGNKTLIKHGKYEQSYKEGADELRITPSFDAQDYDSQVAEKIKKSLADTVKPVTPVNLEEAMKNIIDICGKYLAQNAEYNKDKGPAFKLLVQKMKENSMEMLLAKGPITKTMGQGAKELEEAKGLHTDHDDPNLSQQIYLKLSDLVADTPPEMMDDMNQTLDLASKYLSQRAVDDVERGPAFDLLVKELDQRGDKPFAADIPNLATDFNAAHALTNAPGLSSVKPDPATQPMFDQLLHREVDGITPPAMRQEMAGAVTNASNYLSGYARDREEAKRILINTMKSTPQKEAAKRNDRAMTYGEGAKEVETSPALTPVLPVKNIANEMGGNLDKDVASATPRDMKNVMKAVVNDAAGEMSQNLALKSGAGGERYPIDLVAATAESLGDKPLFKQGPYGMSYKEAGETLKAAGKLEHDPANDKLGKEIADEFLKGFQTQLTPDTVQTLKPTITEAAHHLAKVGNEFGNALDYLLGLVAAKNDAPFAKLQGVEQTYGEVAKKVANAPNLSNDKVDKGAYETVRTKLKALINENPALQYEGVMPDVIETISKFLARSGPESGFVPETSLYSDGSGGGAGGGAGSGPGSGPSGSGGAAGGAGGGSSGAGSGPGGAGAGAGQFGSNAGGAGGVTGATGGGAGAPGGGTGGVGGTRGVGGTSASSGGSGAAGGSATAAGSGVGGTSAVGGGSGAAVRSAGAAGSGVGSTGTVGGGGGAAGGSAGAAGGGVGGTGAVGGGSGAAGGGAGSAGTAGSVGSAGAGAGSGSGAGGRLGATVGGPGAAGTGGGAGGVIGGTGGGPGGTGGAPSGTVGGAGGAGGGAGVVGGESRVAARTADPGAGAGSVAAATVGGGTKGGGIVGGAGGTAGGAAGSSGTGAGGGPGETGRVASSAGGALGGGAVAKVDAGGTVGAGSAKRGKYAGDGREEDSGWPGGPESAEEAERRRKRLSEARKRAGEGGIAASDPEHDSATKILYDALKKKGNETFYQQPQTVLSHAGAADILIRKPLRVDQSVRESPDADRLAKKFERKLGGLVQDITPNHLREPMTDVIIESARELSEYFVARNYNELVNDSLISEMQKKGNEILIETDSGAAETFFYAAQRLKKEKSVEADQPWGRVAHQIQKKLEDCIKCRTMPRKISGTLKDHVKTASNYLSGRVTQPDEKIEAYVALLREMEGASDERLIEGEIPKSYKEAANYLKQLTSFEDQINMPNASLQAATENKLKALMKNVPPTGYSSKVLAETIKEQTGLLVSYVMLQAERTKALDYLVSKMEAVPDKILLRHGIVRKTFFDAADFLHGKNADQLSVQNPDPVASRKIQIKLLNLLGDKTPESLKPVMDSVIEDATAYLAVHLLRAQIIRVCKCMKSVFVQCELWCEEILRHVAKPCCTCSRHASAQVVSEMAPDCRLRISPSQMQAYAPGVHISVTQCPSKGATVREPEQFCPAENPPARCHNRFLDAYFMQTTNRFEPATKLARPGSSAEIYSDESLGTGPTTTESSNEDEEPSSPLQPSQTHALPSQPMTSSNADSKFSRDSLLTSSTLMKEPILWQNPEAMAMHTSYALADARKSRNTSPTRTKLSARPYAPKSNAEDSPSLVTTDQMSDLHAMIVSLMWNVQAWRDWLQENIDRALEDHHDTGLTNAEAYKKWLEYRNQVIKEALQWRKYNTFSRQLTLRLGLRYKDKKLNETELLHEIPGDDLPLHEICWAHFKRKVLANLTDWNQYNTHLKVCWEQKYSAIISDWMPSWKLAARARAPVWVMSACGAVPSGAVPAGEHHGEVAWLARTTHQSEVLPAALIPSKHCCIVYANGGVYRYNKYQVMCNAEVRWAAWRAGAECAGGGGGGGGGGAVRVAAGVRVGRVLYRGAHLVGAVLAPDHRCHVVISGRPFAFTRYQLLLLAGPDSPSSLSTTASTSKTLDFFKT